MRRFKAPEIVEGQRISLPAAAVVAIVSGVALGGAAAIGVALGWTEPYWVPEPILILALYIIMGELDAFDVDHVLFQYSRRRRSCGSSATSSRWRLRRR